MASIEKTNVGMGTPLAAAFDFNSAAPLDSRLTVPTYEGLAALASAGAAYAGMRVYVETGDKKGNYQYIDGAWVNETDEIRNWIGSVATAAMEFKGTITNGTLPENGDKGDMYKVATSSIVISADSNAEAEEEVTARPGDSIVCDENGKWYLIPSGDDIEDTWRPVKVGEDTLETSPDSLEVTVAIPIPVI